MGEKPTNKRALLRYEKIVDAGLELFLQKGYDATSLSDIIASCGGSLSTVYKYFENKEGLFRAILESGIRYFNDEIAKKIELSQNLSVRVYLENFATVYLDAIFSPRAVMFQRLIALEGFRGDMKLGKIFIDYGAMEINQILVNYFKNSSEIANRDQANCEKLSLYFRLLIREPYLFNAVFLKESFNLSQSQKIFHIKNSVELFLNGCLKG